MNLEEGLNLANEEVLIFLCGILNEIGGFFLLVGLVFPEMGFSRKSENLECPEARRINGSALETAKGCPPSNVTP